MKNLKKIVALLLGICICFNLNLFHADTISASTQSLVIKSFSIDKKVVTAGDTVTITIAFSNINKVVSGDLMMTTQLPNSTVASSLCTTQLTDNGDGTYSCQREIDDRVYNGDYYLDIVSVKDVDGNEVNAYYSESDFPNTKFTVIGCEDDVEPPVFKSISIDKKNVTAGDTVTFTVAASDESEISKSSIIMNMDQGCGSLECILLTDNGNGTYSGTLNITKDTKNGAYYFSYIYLQDSLGNITETHYSKTDYPNAKFTVSNCEADIDAPVVESASVDKHIVKPEETLTVTIAASDAHKIESGSVQFVNPNVTGSIYVDTLVDNGNGTYTGKFKLKSYQENGEYYLKYIDLCDSVANGLTRQYTKEQYPDAVFTVCSEFDPPEMDVASLTVLSPQVNGEEEESVNFKASDASGIKDAFVTYLTPETQQEKTYTCYYDRGSGSYYADIPYGDYNEFGKWILKSIKIDDKLVSTKNIISSEVSTTGENTVDLSAGDFEVTLKLGDVTQDNEIDIYDILAIQRHILGVSTLVGKPLKAADVTGDGCVDIYDILGIQRYILGIEDFKK